MLKKMHILSLLLLFVILLFAGCQEDSNAPTDPIDNSNSSDQSLSKYGGSDDGYYDFDSHYRGNSNAVYTLSNSISGNEVIVYRSRHGKLYSAGSYSTGGLGTGGGLGSQGAIIVRGNFIFAVNAGSNEISVLSTGRHGLELVDKVSSGGTTPISVTVHRNLLYVLNAGDAGNIAGFNISRHGKLSPISGSIQPLSTSASGPAQIEFNPRGNVLVVTEKATNSITTYAVGHDGVASAPNNQPSAGDTPFGFEFDRRGRLIVSDAYGGGDLLGAMSSYNVSPGGISLISGPVVNTQTAPCWVVVTKNGKFTYTSNTGTGNISGYRIKHDGSLELFNDGGNTGSTGEGSKPVDMSISNNSQYLYCLNRGNQTISVFRIDNRHGDLKPLQTVTGLPTSVVGIAAN
jgi:6-phosphogluconolactonase